MLQTRKKDYEPITPPNGGKETDAGEEGVRRPEDRTRAKSFGAEDRVRWPGLTQLGNAENS